MTTKTDTTSDQNTNIDLSKYDLLTEGSTTILFPKNNVFYNPVQQYNRDLSSLAIRAYTEMYLEEGSQKRNKQPVGSSKIPHRDELKQHVKDGNQEETVVNEESTPKPFARLLEALSASGLRAIRYSKEIPLLSEIVANDLSSHAVKSIQLNCDYNNAKNVRPNEANAITHMANNPSFYHVIDLDPYGTVSPFIDSAINSAKNGALLLITCTDLGVLAGNGYPEKCFSLYGGVNVWGDATHESALRLVHGMIARTAAKYGVSIEPVLSLSIDFYVRVFIRVWHKPIQVKELMSSNEIVVKCSGCHSTIVQPMGKISEPDEKGRKKYGLAKVQSGVSDICKFCGYTNHICGPMWGGALHNRKFIDKILKLVDEEESKTEPHTTYGTLKRVRGMLTMAKNELGDSENSLSEILNSQFYFATTTISKVLKIPAPSIEDFCAALGNLGYNASLTHASSNCIKTNALWDVIWFIGQQFAKKSEFDIERLSHTTAGYNILKNENISKLIDLKSAMKETLKLSEEDAASKTEKDVIDWLFTANEVSKRVQRLRKIKIVRYQENPTKNWGPKARPK
ncbi:RNA methyltransferase tRNA(m5U54)methyltransferase [Pichia californica]|uniref:tRNA (guanine(26)-N(2))-dimethyltransferase n=1 Tax=Pichia californica TaxID=460514 RepID=A0A9P6WLT9_9ASCO|nr:RNA methyltransferase tRNA(m5U54)methyltransferase [[Candida] californica]KAG0689291.1 RNA methyltransferase tRNA(m5U54)methyltransferase [[Candida] californica]